MLKLSSSLAELRARIELGWNDGRIHGSVAAARLRGQLGQLVLGHAHLLLVGWLAWLIPIAWVDDCVLARLFFSLPLELGQGV